MVRSGRQKIEIKLIDNKATLLVSFSKRRSGLFKMAKELNILCGARMGAVVFSPSGKLFTLDSPALAYLLFLQFPSDLPPLVEVEGVADDWESAFVKAMAGKAAPLWWKRADVLSMEREELLRLEKALLSYREKHSLNEMVDFVQRQQLDDWFAELSHRTYVANRVIDNAQQPSAGWLNNA